MADLAPLTILERIELAYLKARRAIGEDVLRRRALIALRSSPPVGLTDASQSKVEGETKQSPNPPLKGEGP